MFEPNQDVIETPHPRLHYHATINSLGYRGREIAREKPAGVVRILSLGDSGTFGQFVNDDQTWPAYLEDLLRKAHLPVEVVNAGVPGTTIVDQVEFLRRSLTLNPDIVILTFSENDIADLAADIPQYVSLERNRQLKSAPGFKWFYELVRDTALFNYFLTVKATWATHRSGSTTTPPPTSNGSSPPLQYEKEWKMYSEYLEAMRQSLARGNVRFLFNAFPAHHRIGTDTMLDEHLRGQIDRVEALARQKNIPTVSILPSFIQSGLQKEDLYHLPYDGHANHKGYYLHATALLPLVHTTVLGVMGASSRAEAILPTN
jgi:hypothetical protein